VPSWKKIIVSGSNAELNQITSSAGINIKTVGSLTNGISFGDGNTGFYETADNDLKFDRAGINVFQANTSSQLAFGVSSLFRNTTGGFLISTGATTTGANYSFRGDENTGIGRPAADQVSVIAGGVQELIVKANTISGSATSTGSFGRVENASGKFRVLGTTAEISSPGLTQLHIFQDGLGTNTAAPSIKLSNNSQGNNYDIVLSVGTNQLIVDGHVVSQDTFRGDAFDLVNARGTAGTAAFTATGNGGDGGGMYFGGGGAFDVRFSTTEKERLRIDTEGNGGGIQTSGSLQVGSLTAGATSDITATGNISGSATSTGSFGKLLGDGSSLTGIVTDLSSDTTPQLGGNLDLNSNNITGTGNIDILGTITAQNFIVSSSVTSIEYQSISGSTIFGDTADDTHTFLGDTISGSSTSTGSFGILKLASYNSALGGSNNTIFGKGAGVDLTSGDSNTLIGTSAGANITTDSNVVAIGQNAGFTGTTKLSSSVIIGKGALQAGSQSQLSVVIGTQAGYSLSSTHTNGTVAIGHQSQFRSETGRYNTGLGYATLSTNVDGDSNTAVGYASMYWFEAANDGEGDNTAVGTNALNNATTGTHNTAVGSHVARTGTNDLTTGTGNTLIGSYAALSSGSAVNEIVIGSGSIGLGDNQTVIGNSGQTHVVFGGDALISGSAQSTGSFGKLLGDGSSLTGISATSDVVDDTSPQLGGDLDLNSNDITGTGNINMVGTHQITGSLNISGSSDPLTVNSAGSNGIGLLLQGDVISQTPLIKFASAGGNLPGGGTIGFTNGGFQFTSAITSTGGVSATSFNTSQRGSQGALWSNNGGNAGIGFIGGGNAAIDFQTSDTTRLQIEVDGTITIVGDTVIGGDLTVNGDTTTISTSNILVQDAFGFFATGSAGTNVDAGIIVQSGSFVDSGSALYHDISSERWSVGKGIASTATNVPDSKWGGFVATVYTASASPVGSSPKYGVGEIHVDDDGEIYIYS
jgi:hypothetical protein